MFLRTVMEGDGCRQPIEVVLQIGKWLGLCAAEWHMPLRLGGLLWTRLWNFKIWWRRWIS